MIRKPAEELMRSFAPVAPQRGAATMQLTQAGLAPRPAGGSLDVVIAPAPVREVALYLRLHAAGLGVEHWPAEAIADARRKNPRLLEALEDERRTREQREADARLFSPAPQGAFAPAPARDLVQEQLDAEAYQRLPGIPIALARRTDRINDSLDAVAPRPSMEISTGVDQRQSTLRPGAGERRIFRPRPSASDIPRTSRRDIESVMSRGPRQKAQRLQADKYYQPRAPKFIS